MSLLQTKLKDELLKMFDETNPGFVGWPTDALSAATNWSNAYNTYALDSVDVSGDSLLLSNPTGFQNALLATMIPVGGIVSAAAVFDLAFLAYWTGAIFNIGSLPPNGIGGNSIFGVEITSTVLLATPGILNSLLLTEFAVLSDDPIIKADSLATAFHTATTTAVNVLITGLDTTPPTAGPLPIVNNNFVF